MPFLPPNQQRQSTEGNLLLYYYSYTHTHPFNSPISLTTQVSWYQKGKTNLDFTEARDIEWQLHQLGRVQVCTLLQTDNHTRTSPLCFLQAGCSSCRPTIRYDTRCYFNVRSKADISQLNLLHGFQQRQSIEGSALTLRQELYYYN